MNRNGQVILELQGTKKDFVGAWIMRLFQAALATITAAAVIWFGKLILASVLYLVNTLPPMQADVKDLKRDVHELKQAQVTVKEELKAAAAKAEKDLSAAEERVKNEFSRQLEEQIRKNKLQTKDKLNYAR